MDQARKKIREVLATAQCPAVLCSFGRDSLLLLALVREICPDVRVIWFRTGNSESFPKQIMREWGVVGLSPSPATVTLLVSPEGDISLVPEYDFAGDRLPVVHDVTPSDRCMFNIFPTRTPNLFHPWDVLLVGWKDSDTHWLLGQTPLKEDGFMLGRAKVFAPLRHMTDDQVRAAVIDLQLPYRPMPDELPACTRCMTANTDEVYCPELKRIIPRSQWEADKTLTGFQRRFNLEDHHA